MYYFEVCHSSLSLRTIVRAVPYPFGEPRTIVRAIPYPFGKLQTIVRAVPYPFGELRTIVRAVPYPFGELQTIVRAIPYPFGEPRTIVGNTEARRAAMLCHAAASRRGGQVAWKLVSVMEF